MLDTNRKRDCVHCVEMFAEYFLVCDICFLKYSALFWDKIRQGTLI